MVQEKDEYGHDAKETTKTGSDLPKGDGTLSDEGFNRLVDDGTGEPTGQDHSTENRENQMPTSGVGAFEDSTQPLTSTVARIEDDADDKED